MIVQCPACKTFHQKSDDQNDLSVQDRLCAACLTAHIEQMLFGRSLRSVTQAREPSHQSA